jgi:hypothetical protein
MTPEEHLLLAIFKEIMEKGFGELRVVVRDKKVVRCEEMKLHDFDKRLKD